MAQVPGKEEDFTFFYWNIDGRLAGFGHGAYDDVALELVEEFLGGIVVVVAALVGTADDGDHELAVFPDLRVADGRF